MIREADINKANRFQVKADSLPLKGQVMKLVLFDADGTLIDSQAIIHETMKITFTRFGFNEPTLAATRSIIGLTLDRAIATILGRDIDADILSMSQEYKDIYIELAPRDDMQCQAFEGIPQLIRDLANKDDYLLGVVTGKSRRGVDRLFNSNGFGDCFVVSRCADDCPSKPHPAMVLECCNEMGIRPADTIVIGDTSFDMEMGVAAGATTIGVNWGYHPRKKMEAAGANSIVSSITELRSKIDFFSQKKISTLHRQSAFDYSTGLLNPLYA